MDQIKIGKFISDERKQKHYTQRQLAQLPNISDKTISKRETGNGFPEVPTLLPLCEILDISVNDLLSGERLSDTDYKVKAEENTNNIYYRSHFAHFIFDTYNDSFNIYCL